MAKRRSGKKSGKKSFWGKFFAGVGIAALAVVVTGLGFGTYKYLTTGKVDAGLYEQGQIAVVTGENVESEASIRMKEGVSVKGLKVDIQEEGAKVEAQVFFYAEDGTFVSCTDVLTEDFVANQVTEENEDGNVPAEAVTARVVLTPLEDEDGVVSEDEIAGYAKEVKVTYSK